MCSIFADIFNTSSSEEEITDGQRLREVTSSESDTDGKHFRKKGHNMAAKNIHVVDYKQKCEDLEKEVLDKELDVMRLKQVIKQKDTLLSMDRGQQLAALVIRKS